MHSTSVAPQHRPTTQRYIMGVRACTRFLCLVSPGVLRQTKWCCALWRWFSSSPPAPLVRVPSRMHARCFLLSVLASLFAFPSSSLLFFVEISAGGVSGISTSTRAEGGAGASSAARNRGPGGSRQSSIVSQVSTQWIVGR